jgi:hypothetical protein
MTLRPDWRCVECSGQFHEDDDSTRTASGPLCGSCSEALAQPEVVSPKLIRLYRRVQEDEARRAVRPLCSGVHVSPTNSPRAVGAAEGRPGG